MSHHFDSPTAIEDGRLNLCDLYAFPGPSDTSTLILTIESGRWTIVTDDVPARRPLRVRHRLRRRHRRRSSPSHGLHRARARRAAADAGALRRRRRAAAAASTGGRSASGPPMRSSALDGGGVAWFGAAADPFWADGVALALFVGALEAGDYRPEVFGAEPSNIFAGRNVTAIALQLPNSTLPWIGRQPVGSHQPLRPRRTEAGQPVRQPDGAAAVLPRYQVPTPKR